MEEKILDTKEMKENNEQGIQESKKDFAEFKPKRFQLLSDVWSFMKVRKKWWLLPIIVLLILVGTLIVIGQSSALSPFIYALF
ncbi:hypothetical protein J4232_00525 [Candidatus Woesearchaeota archaeon]|nr:hypothetical protein [Candidatus Woesearchaeota archaeon]